jgi:lysozyme family protein
MKGNFTRSLDFVLRHECVYAPGHDNDFNFVVCEDVPGDTGGLTKFGIDEASHPGIDIRDLTLDRATGIYRNGEWVDCRCDELPAGIDTATFDCAVNNGVAVSGILLQRAINGCGRRVAVDGEIGPETIQAAAAARRSDLQSRMLELRRERYADIILHNPGDAKFLKGWLNRVDDLEAFLNRECTETNTGAASA